MISMKRFVYIVAFSSAGCSSLFDYDETSSEYYSTHSEVVRRNGFDSGWLPMDMPVSARDIMEAHSIDSGEIWIQFQLESSEADSFLKKCTAREGIDLPDRRRTRRVAPWWPEEMLDSTASRATGWRTYFCEDMRHAGMSLSSSVAFNAETGKVLYWIKK